MPSEPERHPDHPDNGPEEEPRHEVEHRHRGEERDGHPERHFAETRGRQEPGKAALDLRQAGVLVHPRDLRDGVGRDHPEGRPRGRDDPREVDVHAFAVRQDRRSSAIAVRREPVVGEAAGITAQAVEIAFEPVVEDETELVRRLFPVDRHLLLWPLQVLGGRGAVAPLRGFDESQECPAGRFAAKRVFLGNRRRLNRRCLRCLRGSRTHNGNETDGEDECGEPRSPPRQHGHDLAPPDILADAPPGGGVQNLRPAETCTRVPLSNP